MLNISKKLGVAALSTTAAVASAAPVSFSLTGANCVNSHSLFNNYYNTDFQQTFGGVDMATNNGTKYSIVTSFDTDDFNTPFSYYDSSTGNYQMGLKFAASTQLTLSNNFGQAKTWNINAPIYVGIERYGADTHLIFAPSVNETDQGMMQTVFDMKYNASLDYSAAPTGDFYKTLLAQFSGMSAATINSSFTGFYVPGSFSSAYTIEFENGQTSLQVPSSGAMGTLVGLAAIVAPRRRREIAMA